MSDETRKESEVFKDLERLCGSPGFVHVIAAICFLESRIVIGSELRPEDLRPKFSRERLIRTEIATLIALTIKSPSPDLEHPGAERLRAMLEEAHALLGELHESINAPVRAAFASSIKEGKVTNPLETDDGLRESFFYSGESAYPFQYRDLLVMKYSDDDKWLIANLGFSAADLRTFHDSITNLQRDKIAPTFDTLTTESFEEFSLLPIFEFDIADVAEKSGLSESVTEAIALAFCANGKDGKDGIETFDRIGNFNPVAAYPIIQSTESRFVVFQDYALAQAFYETPYYLMQADPAYRDVASDHRGIFPEAFSEECLERVFGPARVTRNVQLKNGRGEDLGEIDTLVIFADRAVVIQAKSKRLTIGAQAGSQTIAAEDFRSAVQHACDQAISCARLLLDRSIRVLDGEGNPLHIPRRLSHVYPVCVVADHYPQLNAQTHQLLRYSSDAVVSAPFVSDLFFLDVVTELLDSPLRLISYLDRRADYGKRVMAGHELVVLGFHLNNNLYLPDGVTGAVLHDDLATNIDIAMMVRRLGLPGQAVPPGILTRLVESEIGRLIDSIEHSEDPRTIDLGSMLLTLSEDAVLKISHGIGQILEKARRSYQNEDLTVPLPDTNSGLTIHCGFDPTDEARGLLSQHARTRKYMHRANSWFGVALDPGTGKPRLGVNLKSPWVMDSDMERVTRTFKRGRPTTLTGAKEKVGRNEPCPCGSGVKFKKCCGS